MAKKLDTGKQPDKPGPKKRGFSFYWIYGILAVAFILMQLFNYSSGTIEITWQEFERNMLYKHHVSKIIVVNKEMAEVFIKKDILMSDTAYKNVRTKGFGGSVNPGPHYQFTIGSVESFKEDLNNAQETILARDTTEKTIEEKAEILEEPGVSVIYETRRNWTGDLLSWLIPIFLIIVFWFFLMRMMGRGQGGGQIFNFGKSKARLFDPNTSINITFKDVAGLEEAKVEVMEIVDFLKNPKKYTELGGKIPKGALLVGPPGTGKTLLAKAVAGEAQVPFFSLSGSDFVEMFVGVGASRVRDLFKQAKEKAPCIVFIDEIDAIGRARGKNPMTGTNDERENTLNQLLTEMDGFTGNTGVIILAATNRADVLDRALMRAGRFDRQIHIELPDLEGRKEIFKVHVRPLKMDETTNLEFLAKQTPGFSGADIANVCNEAALIAARKNKKQIERQDFIDAIDRIVGGLEKRSKIISFEEKKVIAFHEAGHASVSWLLQYAHPLVKVTIVPRGKSLGAAWYLPEERQITTFEQMFDEVTAALGGRAAEDIIFGKVSTGALNDLEKVTKQVYAMVVYFGLSEKLGNISYYDSSGQQEFSFTKPYSEKTAEMIDKEISKMIESAYKRAKDLLLKNKEKLKLLADQLLDKEVIFREDVESIFGKRPYKEKEHPVTMNGKEIEPVKENKLAITSEGKNKKEGKKNNNQQKEQPK